MTNYQKAIKVRKTCENISITEGSKCPYFEKCRISDLSSAPCYENLEKLSEVIIKEKWQVK